MSKVSLVLISHSEDIAIGLKKLLLQIQPDLAIACAGGSEGEIGTNAIRIKEAIESVYTDSGVVILFDLGSALLNAEMAIDLLEEKENILIADAPLVEGAYAAAIKAGMGGNVQEVVEVSESARTLIKRQF